MNWPPVPLEFIRPPVSRNHHYLSPDEGWTEQRHCVSRNWRPLPPEWRPQPPISNTPFLQEDGFQDGMPQIETMVAPASPRMDYNPQRLNDGWPVMSRGPVAPGGNVQTFAQPHDPPQSGIFESNHPPMLHMIRSSQSNPLRTAATHQLTLSHEVPVLQAPYPQATPGTQPAQFNPETIYVQQPAAYTVQHGFPGQRVRHGPAGGYEGNAAVSIAHEQVSRQHHVDDWRHEPSRQLHSGEAQCVPAAQVHSLQTLPGPGTCSISHACEAPLPSNDLPPDMYYAPHADPQHSTNVYVVRPAPASTEVHFAPWDSAPASFHVMRNEDRSNQHFCGAAHTSSQCFPAGPPDVQADNVLRGPGFATSPGPGFATSGGPGFAWQASSTFPGQHESHALLPPPGHNNGLQLAPAVHAPPLWSGIDRAPPNSAYHVQYKASSMPSVGLSTEGVQDAWEPAASHSQHGERCARKSPQQSHTQHHIGDADSTRAAVPSAPANSHMGTKNTEEACELARRCSDSGAVLRDSPPKHSLSHERTQMVLSSPRKHANSVPEFSDCDQLPSRLLVSGGGDGGSGRGSMNSSSRSAGSRSPASSSLSSASSSGRVDTSHSFSSHPSSTSRSLDKGGTSLLEADSLREDVPRASQQHALEVGDDMHKDQIAAEEEIEEGEIVSGDESPEESRQPIPQLPSVPLGPIEFQLKTSAQKPSRGCEERKASAKAVFQQSVGDDSNTHDGIDESQPCRAVSEPLQAVADAGDCNVDVAGTNADVIVVGDVASGEDEVEVVEGSPAVAMAAAHDLNEGYAQKECDTVEVQNDEHKNHDNPEIASATPALPDPAGQLGPVSGAQAASAAVAAQPTSLDDQLQELRALKALANRQAELEQKSGSGKNAAHVQGPSTNALFVERANESVLSRSATGSGGTRERPVTGYTEAGTSRPNDARKGARTEDSEREASGNRAGQQSSRPSQDKQFKGGSSKQQAQAGTGSGNVDMEDQRTDQDDTVIVVDGPSMPDVTNVVTKRRKVNSGSTATRKERASPAAIPSVPHTVDSSEAEMMALKQKLQAIMKRNRSGPAVDPAAVAPIPGHAGGTVKRAAVKSKGRQPQVMEQGQHQSQTEGGQSREAQLVCLEYCQCVCLQGRK